MDNKKNEREERGIEKDNSKRMNMEEDSIKWLKSLTINIDSEDIVTDVMTKQTIKLLKQGGENKKYKEMWEELGLSLHRNYSPGYILKGPGFIMYKLEQKYFLEEK